jgi:5'-nucleotidase
VPDGALQKIVDRYATLAAPIADRVVGSVTADITKENNPAGESSLGDIVADAQLEATRAAGSGGAIVALMNEGGIRTDVPFVSSSFGANNGDVAYGELFNVQPFGDSLVTMNLTGTQIKTLLEEQFKGCALDFPASDSAAPAIDRILQVSNGFAYTWNKDGAACNKVDPGSIKINGALVTPTAKYRITVNSYLADGGDQLYVLKEGTDRLGGPQGVDVLTAYFARHRPLAPGQPHRISVIPE